MSTEASKVRSRLSFIERGYFKDPEVKATLDASTEAGKVKSLEFKRFMEELKNNTEYQKLKNKANKSRRDEFKANKKVNELYEKLVKADLRYSEAIENQKAAFRNYRSILIEKASANEEYKTLRKKLKEEFAVKIKKVMLKLHGDKVNLDNIDNW